VTGTGLAPVVREVGVFILVGATATGCHYAVTLAANRFAGLDLNMATLVGYVCSVGVSYFGNSLFTFRRPVLHGPQFARFAAISLAGLAVNQAVVFVSAHVLGWPPWLALIPVVVLVPASTFTLAKFWAFKPPADAADQGP
jgi:putative flippase GtrA